MFSCESFFDHLWFSRVLGRSGRGRMGDPNQKYLHDETVGKPLGEFLKIMQTGGPK